jgi:NAD(P)H-dependent FMN reductase
MKILVLNGSPKGELSVTMQYVRYMQKRNPTHDFAINHISQRIKLLDEHPEAFAEVIGQVRTADALLWATPVYYFLVPTQYKQIGAYDFPQRDLRQRIATTALATLLRLPGPRERIRRNMKQQMVAPYRKVVDAVPAQGTAA